MAREFAQDLRARRALASQGIGYGKKPHISFRHGVNTLTLFAAAGAIALVAGIMTTLVGHIFQHNISDQLIKARANKIAFIVFFAILLLPYLQLIFLAIKQLKRPSFHDWQTLTRTRQNIANLALAYLITVGMNNVYTFAVTNHYLKPLPLISTTTKAVDNSTTDNLPYKHDTSTSLSKPIRLNTATGLGLWGILTLLLYLTTTRLQKEKPTTNNKKRLFMKIKNIHSLPFGLWLGESTGELSRLSHGAGMAPGQNVALFTDDAAQNILVLGATGSGKTTRAINPLLLQLLEQDCGGLIFDIKGDFHQTVESLSGQMNAAYAVIGAAEQPFNLLAGLTPEIASSFLKSAFLLSSGQKHDGFWIDTATELCRNVLGILSFTEKHYSLLGLYNFLFDRTWRNQYYEDIAELNASLDSKQQRLLKSYQHYYETIFSDFDEKVQAGVRATIAQVLAPFNHPELIDAFCTATPQSINLEDVLNGQIFLVNMPLSRWGLGGKVVYTFLKLRFFNLMQSRVTHPEWNQNRFVFLLCDEYQEIVSANKDGLSDLNFWDKSRSSKTIGIISSQSVSSFYAAIGDRDMAIALLQNFRQKICFRIEDENTIALLNRLLGMVEIQRVTTTQSSGRNSSGLQSSSHASQSTSISTLDKPLLDGQFFRTLPRDHALVLLSVSGNGCDDVLKMESIFH